MNNIFEPPKSEVYERPLRVPRPLGIIIIAVLFILFSAADTLVLFMEKDSGWTIVLGASVVIAFLLRGIVIGLEKSRKNGVFLGFFSAALNALVIFTDSEEYSDANYIISIAESLFVVMAAIYLMMLKGNSFFIE